MAGQPPAISFGVDARSLYPRVPADDKIRLYRPEVDASEQISGLIMLQPHATATAHVLLTLSQYQRSKAARSPANALGLP